MHIFWVAGLLLAMIDLPDFGTPMRSIADSVERIADAAPGAPGCRRTPDDDRPPRTGTTADAEAARPRKKERSHV